MAPEGAWVSKRREGVDADLDDRLHIIGVTVPVLALLPDDVVAAGLLDPDAVAVIVVPLLVDLTAVSADGSGLVQRGPSALDLRGCLYEIAEILVGGLVLDLGMPTLVGLPDGQVVAVDGDDLAGLGVPAVVVLDDVVVIAYGVRKKGTIAGSVSTVGSEKLADVPAASFDQALQGQTPGLTVLSSSGEPSSAASFQIRGINSINSGTSPLFILDGIPISSSDFNAINPADIESVSVLKDASSTSIYGARAANGVVVITTKRGSLGKAKVTARAQVGFSSLARNNWNMMNTSERIAYEKEVGLAGGKDYSVLGRIDYNWLEEVFRNDALLQNYDIAVDGSTDKVRYYVSGNFYDQQGISLDSHFRRYNVRANVEAKAKEWMKVGANVLLTHEDISVSEQGTASTVTPISAARFMLPYWSPYKSDGKTYASVSDGTWKGTNQNPLEWMENNPASNDKNKVIGSLFLEFTPIKGLTIRSQKESAQ